MLTTDTLMKKSTASQNAITHVVPYFVRKILSLIYAFFVAVMSTQINFAMA
jgi:hypothetical protein